jgi:hypothetical protein
MNKLIKIIYLFLFFNFILSTQIFNKENGSECSSNLECKHACCKKKKCVKNDDCKNDKYILYYIDGVFCFIFILCVFIYGHFRLKKINKNVEDFKREKLLMEQFEKQQEEKKVNEN